MGRNIRSWVKMIVSSKGLLKTFAPIVPLPEIRPSSQVAAGVVLTKPRLGDVIWAERMVGKRRRKSSCFICIGVMLFHFTFAIGS